jgi:hypothetical protein
MGREIEGGNDENEPTGTCFFVYFDTKVMFYISRL